MMKPGEHTSLLTDVWVTPYPGRTDRVKEFAVTLANGEQPRGYDLPQDKLHALVKAGREKRPVTFTLEIAGSSGTALRITSWRVGTTVWAEVKEETSP